MWHPVLLQIGTGGPRSHSGLLRLLRLAPGYLSRIITKLEEENLVSIMTNPRDARAKVLAHTPAGEQELNRIDHESDRQMADLLAHLDDTALAIIEEARHLGYARMRLAPLAGLEAACGLCRALGFREIPAYYDNPLPGVVYFEMDLGGDQP